VILFDGCDTSELIVASSKAVSVGEELPIQLEENFSLACDIGKTGKVY
jgi:hypothetical protein